MEKAPQELYEYARRRIKQKKRLYFHFVLLLVGTLFMFIINKLLNIEKKYDWFLWAGTAWCFFFILHFIKVFITDRFMNKNWERAEIDKLVQKQGRKLTELERHN